MAGPVSSYAASGAVPDAATAFAKRAKASSANTERLRWKSEPEAVGHVSNVPPQTGFQDGFFTGAPILVAMGLVLLLGLYIPPSLESLLREAAAFLEVKR